MMAGRLFTETATGSGGRLCPDDVGGVAKAVGTRVAPSKPGDEIFDMLPPPDRDPSGHPDQAMR